MQEYKLWLSKIDGLSNTKKIKLISYFKDEEGIFKADKKALTKTGILNLKNIHDIVRSKEDFDKELPKKLKKAGIKYVTFGDKNYPAPLLNIFDAPYCLFYLGNLPKTYDKCIAMVGARNCTAYGRCAAEDISSNLSNEGALIVSGMARGIDTASHQGALRAGKSTIAILGCGVDVCYPIENKRLYYDIIEKGCIISEFFPGTSPLPVFFPRRNRIISGLSRAVIVIEARNKSGSLITADLALEQGKDVYALPGRISDTLSGGTNKLIFQGAQIITSPEDLILSFMDNGILPFPLKNSKSPDSLEYLFSLIDYNPIGIDALMEKTGLGLPDLFNSLLELKSKGLIKEEGKNRYVKNII